MTVALVVFVASLVVTLYIYVGYPCLLFLLRLAVPTPIRRAPVHPMVTLIIPAFNEARVIADKIENSLRLQYPRDSLEILVVSDGSTDATEAIAARYADAGVTLLRLPRRGKAWALNAGVTQATGEILVFSDANGMLDPESLSCLVEGFADLTVGGVCGNKRFRAPGDADTTEVGEGLYWRYDQWQKSLESDVGSVFAADGSLYAIRKALYVPIADLAQADDIAISARVVLQGYRLIYEPRAVVVEEAPRDGLAEFNRKILVTNHSVSACLKLGKALWTSGLYSVELISHKLLRHFSPFFLFPLCVSTLVLAGHGGVFLIVLAVETLFCAMAVVGFVARTARVGRLPCFTVPYYFCLVNAAAFAGVWSLLAGARPITWTPRGGISDPGGAL